MIVDIKLQENALDRLRQSCIECFPEESEEDREKYLKDAMPILYDYESVRIDEGIFNLPNDIFFHMFVEGLENKKPSDYDVLYFDDWLEDKKPYGLADNLEQIKEYLSPYYEDKNHNYFINVNRIDWHPENNGKTGGFRPYKWGPYLGTYNQIDECEYYDDCEFPEDYQGYLISFHVYMIN